MSELITLPDGRVFPCYNSEALPWSIGACFHIRDQQEGYPRTLAILRAVKAHRPEQFEQERRDLVRSSLGGVFRHNARELLRLLESV